ncbi:mechanosensitive ion channel family protein [Chryseobacterium koreense]|uniref:Mechanosensitive ion channel protein MscS n=1 Tax=Chryseobacterium koreense CCUG 49689 TaxID=1304281 RepID=A0A0J7J1Y9_9FLAO|nr:mechanosensitive ion channel domain-containing protein [Chryseobacterium koreense]KMQ72287.1 mechanosensitive ion channel protein MscS [Chryseobacterium koreense CCUG 49689]MBB5334023.1 small conductance mechanosensitive channel [Chryseobacterium koreense]
MNYFSVVSSVLERWYLTFAQFTPKLIVGILVFSFFLLASSFLSRSTVKLFRRLFPESHKAETVTNLVGFFRFLIILFGTFVSLEIMGLSGFFMKLLGSLGVAGIIAGVALKDLVSSMFSGVLVGIDKSFKPGDVVQISNVTGTVEEIGFLTTKIIADDGKKVYLPNQLIFSSPFINFSASGNRKIFIDIEIPNTQDLEKAKVVILDEVRKLDAVDRLNLAQVILLKQSFGIFTIEAQFWIKQGLNIAVMRSEALLRIKQRLDQEEIQMVNPNQNR